MKSRTALLAIFLTLTRTGLYADASSSDIATQTEQTLQVEASENQNELAQVVSGPAAQKQESTQTEPTQDASTTSEEEKYVSEDNESNRKNKDNSMLYNFLLALAAIAVATAAIILVSNNKGSKVER